MYNRGHGLQTTQALIKETLAARKNTSPQNVYETGQLYAVGALKVACIGLQCIGFNNVLYEAILEHATQCTQSGKWRSPGLSADGTWGEQAATKTVQVVGTSPKMLSSSRSGGFIKLPSLGPIEESSRE